MSTTPTTSTGVGTALEAVHARLLAAVTALSEGDAWRTVLAVAARFSAYSPSNQLLIATQRPDATRVAGYRAWQRLGRQVRAGEHGIAILAPMLRRRTPDESASQQGAGDQGPTTALTGFTVTRVFDVAQTDGDPLPEIPTPRLLAGGAPAGLWDALSAEIEAAGYRLDRAPTAPANGRTDFTRRTVSVDPGLTGLQACKTATHELAHVQLHAPPSSLPRELAEVEAESVAYVVLTAHGADPADYSVPYVTGWAGGDARALAATADRVLGCARRILSGPAAPASAAATNSRDAERHRPIEAGRGLARWIP